MANNKTYSRGIKIYIDGKEVEGSVGNINKQLRKLRGEMKNLTIGTEEYEKKAAEIRKLNGILDEHRSKLKGVENTVEGSVGQMRARVRELTEEIGKLAVGTEEYENKASQLRTLNSLIKEHQDYIKGVGDETQTTSGKFGGLMDVIKGRFEGMGKSFLGGFGSILDGMKGSWLKFAGWLGAAVVALKGTLDAGRWWYDYNTEIEEAQRLTKEFTGLVGKDLTHVQSQISSIAKSMGKDYKEVLSTADMLMNQFGVSADEAINAIKDGIQAGGDLNGTLLQQLNQFAPAAKDAGNSIQDLVSMIVQTRSGIFNESGMAMIQQAENKLRTMSAATAKSLDAIGISSKQLEEDLVSGQTTMFEAVQMVSNKLMELPQNSAAVGQAMKDVFGKTASNEGMAMVAAIGDMTTNMDELKDVTGEYGELQRQQIEAEAELTEKFENFFNIGQSGFQELTGKAKLYITQALISAIDNTKKLVNWFIDLYNKSVVVRGSIQAIALNFRQVWNAAKTSVNLIIDVFKQLGRMLKGVGDTLKGVFTLDFDLMGKGLEQMFNIGPLLKEWKDDAVKGFRDAAGAAADAWNNTLDGKIKPISIEGHSSEAEQGGVVVVGHRKGVEGTADTSNKSMGGKRTIKTDKKNTSKDDAAKAEAKAEAERRKQVQQALAAIDLEYQQKAAALREAFVNGEIAKQEELEQQLLVIEREMLEKKLEVANLEPAERQKILDKIISMQQTLREQVTAALEEIRQSQLSEYDRQREELQNSVDREREVLLQGYEQKLIDKATFDSSIETLEKSHREKLQEIQDAEDEAEKAKRTISARDMLAQVNEKYAIAYDMTMDFANNLGVVLGKAMQGEKKAWHDFLKSIIIMALDAVEKMLPIWMANSTGRNVSILGVAGLPKAAIEMAAITAAIEVAKGIVSTFSEGGYTGKGKKKDPAGIVHKGEYVIPQEGVNNPALKPVLEVMETARRRGTLQQVTETDIAEAVEGETKKEDKVFPKDVSETSKVETPVSNVATSKGNVATSNENVATSEKIVANAPAVSPISIDVIQKSVGSIANLSQNGIKSVYGSTHATPSPSSMPDLGVLRDVASAVRDLRSRLEEPITAQTYTVGKGGIENSQKLVEKMRRNASRKTN